MRIAIISKGLVVNVVVAESLDKMPPIEGCECVAIDDKPAVTFQWTWDGKTFAAPAIAQQERPPSVEDRVAKLETWSKNIDEIGASLPHGLQERIEVLEKQLAALQKGK